MAVASHELPTVPRLREDAPLPPSAQAVVQNQGVEAFKDVAFGSIAGIFGKFVEYPFDTVKVRLQSQTTSATLHGAKPLHGPLDAFADAWRSPDGAIRSLYRGISAPLVGAAIETSSLFFSYRVAQNLLLSSLPSLRQNPDSDGKVELPFRALVACGAASGAFTSILLTPIELIKCKMQVPLATSHLATDLGYRTAKPPGPLKLISSIFKNHGIIGFWHGQLGTLIRETGGSAAWFGSYEGVKISFLQNENKHRLPENGIISDLKVWQQMIAGATAGVSYNFVFYPADTIKSRMQTEETPVLGGRGHVHNATEARKTFLTTGKELWRHQGLKGFYRGCGITVLRAAPSSAIIFSIYESLRQRFG